MQVRFRLRLGVSILEEVSYETLVLETRRSTFGGSLARNARFGDLALHFWRKSRTKCLFWRRGVSLSEEVSYETLVLETWRLTLQNQVQGAVQVRMCEDLPQVPGRVHDRPDGYLNWKAHTIKFYEAYNPSLTSLLSQGLCLSRVLTRYLSHDLQRTQ